MNRTICIATVLLVLGGCASTEQFERMMNSYMGSSIDRVREQFGFNHTINDFGNGNRAYTWRWVERGVTPGYQSPTIISTVTNEKVEQTTVSRGTYFPPTAYEHVCEFSFIVDPTGHVVNWRAQGDGCGSFDGPGRVLGPGRRP